MAVVYGYLLIMVLIPYLIPIANLSFSQPSTPEGMAVAYGSLVIMALIPIFLGAFRSVKHQDEQKAAGEPVSGV